MGQEVWRVPNLTVCYYAGIYDQATLPKTPDRNLGLKNRKKKKDRYESRLNKD